MKITGKQFKQFLDDEAYWKELVLEEDTYRINGEPVDELPLLDDSDRVEILSGYVINERLFREHDTISLKAFFNRWKKLQTMTYFFVRCDVSQQTLLKDLIRANGGQLE